jgi:hypothetical protein
MAPVLAELYKPDWGEIGRNLFVLLITLLELERAVENMRHGLFSQRIKKYPGITRRSSEFGKNRIA